MTIITQLIKHVSQLNTLFDSVATLHKNSAEIGIGRYCEFTLIWNSLEGRPLYISYFLLPECGFTITGLMNYLLQVVHTHLAT